MPPPRNAVPLALALLVGLVTGGVFLRPRPVPLPTLAAAQEDSPSELTEEERRVVDIFERRGRSTVYIRKVALRRDIFSLDVHRVPVGTGSGFVWDEDGHIVTNAHVVEGAHGIRVTLPDQSTWRAELVAVVQDKDLAVLRIDASAEKLHPVVPGRSEDLRVGMTVLAIGNPFGLDHTLTKGIVSALGREIKARTGRTITDVVQTDAAINPGNSGGPLLDLRGRLVGVNTAIVAPNGSNAGIGFAIPVNTVRRVVGQILEHGRVIQPGFGIHALRDDIAKRFGLDKGVMIHRVIPGSPADQAGLRGIRWYRDGSVAAGDVVVKIDEHEVEDSEDLLNTLERYRVGDEVLVSYVRDRKLETVRLKLIEVR